MTRMCLEPIYKVKLADVCEILDNKRIPITASDRKTGIYPYYGANGVQDYVDGYIFDEDLVLLAEDGGNFGSKDKPIAYRVSGKCWVNNHAHVLRPLKNIDVDYLCYSLMFYDVNKLVNGATRKKLNKSEMLKMEVPLLELEEQRQIVKKIKRLENIIESRKKQVDLLDLLIKSRFIEMFGDIVLNDKHHGQYILNDVCVKITDGTHDTPKRIENGYLFLTGKNIRANGIIYDEIEYVSKEVHKEIYKRCNPEYGDVLYTNIGVNYGTACLNNRTDEFSMKNIALLKPNKKILNSYYLWYCLNLMRDFILEKNQAGGAQTFMGLATIKNIKIQVPSIELQNQFASFVQQVDKSKFTHCYELLLLIIKKIWYNNYV